MHIIYICREFPPSLRGGGIASYLREISIGMRHAGHRVTVVCASDDTRRESDTTDEYGVRVIRLKGGDFLIPQVEGHHIVKKLRPLYRFWSYRKRIRECVKQLKDVDVIEVAEYGAESYYLENINVPIIVRLHAPTFVLNRITKTQDSWNLKKFLFRYLEKKEENVVKNAMYMTSCSNALKEIIEKSLKIDGRKMHIILNPIQTENMYSPKRSLITKTGNVELLLAGAIAPLKGGLDLIHACKILLNHSISVKLIMVGKESSFANKLREQYKDEKWLNIKGAVSRKALIEMYNHADIVCIPSWWENMPMVCIEAMLQGAIVIGSSNGGMSEIITDGVDGFLVKPHRPDLLAEKIEQVAEMTEEEKVRMSQAAQQRIRKGFSTEVIVQQTLDYYKYVIDSFNNRET